MHMDIATVPDFHSPPTANRLLQVLSMPWTCMHMDVATVPDFHSPPTANR
jgi:hypothetical protein